MITSWRKPLFLNEIDKAKIKPEDKVLHIGCGIIPTTCILLADKTKASIVGIDNNKRATNYAKKIVSKKNLSDFIKIEYSEGQNYPIHDFNVILIAANVFPIDNVLKHVLKNVKKDTRIICRGKKNDIKDCIDRIGLSETVSFKDITQDSKTQSFLLIKNC